MCGVICCEWLFGAWMVPLGSSLNFMKVLWRAEIDLNVFECGKMRNYAWMHVWGVIVCCECIVCMEIHAKVCKYENGIRPSIISSGNDHVGLLHLAQAEAWKSKNENLSETRSTQVRPRLDQGIISSGSDHIGQSHLVRVEYWSWAWGVLFSSRDWGLRREQVRKL